MQAILGTSAPQSVDAPAWIDGNAHPSTLDLYTQRMLRQRLVTGALLIAALLALAAVDSQVPTLYVYEMRIGPGCVLAGFIALVVAPLMSRELASLCNPRPTRALQVVHFVAIIAGVACLFLAPEMVPTHQLLPLALSTTVGIALLAAVAHARKHSAEGTVAAVGGALLSFAWIGIPMGFWLLLRKDREAYTMAAAILCVKSSDIGAYFTGTLIGRHKLIPWLSPGKSWEGFWGGLVTSAAIGALLALGSQSAWAADRFVEPVSAGWGAFAGAVLGLAGVLGDLFESLLKRGAGVKDSGNVLPGMGGAFDVLDSLLLAGPLAWWLLAS